MISFDAACIALLVLYLAYIGYVMHDLLFPRPDPSTSSSDPTWRPLWQQGASLELRTSLVLSDHNNQQQQQQFLLFDSFFNRSQLRRDVTLFGEDVSLRLELTRRMLQQQQEEEEEEGVCLEDEAVRVRMPEVFWEALEGNKSLGLQVEIREKKTNWRKAVWESIGGNISEHFRIIETDELMSSGSNRIVWKEFRDAQLSAVFEQVDPPMELGSSASYMKLRTNQAWDNSGVLLVDRSRNLWIRLLRNRALTATRPEELGPPKNMNDLCPGRFENGNPYSQAGTPSAFVAKATSNLVVFRDLPASLSRPRYYLVRNWPLLGHFVPEDDPLEIAQRLKIPASHRSRKVRETPEEAIERNKRQIGYWKSISSLHLVADWTWWPVGKTPQTVMRGLKIVDQNPSSLDCKGYYLPVVYTGQLGLTQEKLIQLNTSMESLPLELVISPMSMASWQLRSHLEESLKIQKSFGASEKDLDDLRSMLTDTPPLLMGVTMFVATVHALFDFLAFKSDIGFWRNVNNLKGLSFRSVFIELMCQIIIFLYLFDQQASLLILVPGGIGIMIQAWKVIRAWRLRAQDQIAEAEDNAILRLGAEADSIMVYYMGIILVPLVFLYSLYSLVFWKHPSFASWFISSLASSVYAFGFALMTPQLYINYRLKSVDHLPWKMLIYKACNTFIDDLFAFIIRQPTLHRMACFRDDIIFLIYLYQRRIYQNKR